MPRLGNNTHSAAIRNGERILFVARQPEMLKTLIRAQDLMKFAPNKSRNIKQWVHLKALELTQKNRAARRALPLRTEKVYEKLTRALRTYQVKMLATLIKRQLNVAKEFVKTRVLVRYAPDSINTKMSMRHMRNLVKSRVRNNSFVPDDDRQLFPLMNEALDLAEKNWQIEHFGHVLSNNQRRHPRSVADVPPWMRTNRNEAASPSRQSPRGNAGASPSRQSPRGNAGASPSRQSPRGNAGAKSPNK